MTVKSVSIHEAAVQLTQLLELVLKGDSFIITNDGKPIAKVVPLNVPTGQAVSRLGFMAGKGQVPANFDRMGQAEIEAMFLGDDDT